MTDSGASPSHNSIDDSLLHAFKNHLSVIIGFCELLLRGMPADDPRRVDLGEMYKAGNAAIALLPELTSRAR